MSGVLSREVDAVQNPALAAVLLWRFCVSYAEARRFPASTPLPALFVVLPALFNEDVRLLISSTQKRSGVRYFAAKFTDAAQSKTDVLLSLESQARALRPQTLEAFRLALQSRLLSLDAVRGEVLALSEAPAQSLPESVRPLIRTAEKLGVSSGAVSLFELGSVLHVTF
jgi:hypothetical protein